MEGYSNQPIPKEAAKKLLALDLEDKEILTYEKLDQWYTAWNGKCYVSFSGGKDSTVLAYLAARYLSSFRISEQCCDVMKKTPTAGRPRPLRARADWAVLKN